MTKIARKLSIFLFSVFILPSSLLSAQSAAKTNRNTAVRCLRLAKSYASQKQWKEAKSQTELGLAYDDKIADLWYIKAVSESALGSSKASVLPMVIKSLTEGDWVDYNKDSARILYADILCSTRQFETAVQILDNEPFLYSADAEYIRIKAFYNGGTFDSIQKAREKVNSARRIYPDDQRFAQLFYSYEYALKSGGKITETPDSEALVKSIAKALRLALAKSRNLDGELELYSILFTEGEEKTRLLKSFRARNHTAPLLAQAALEEGLIKEETALDYFYSYADKQIDKAVLDAFVPLVTGEKTKKELYDYLNAYNGVITADTDGDLVPNLTVTYNRGRPKHIEYDGNQDDENDWVSDCDFGVPLSVELDGGTTKLIYDSWPTLAQAVYTRGDGNKTIPRLTFNLASENFSWSPFSIKANQIVKSSLGLDLFFPEVPPLVPDLDGEQLIRASTSYEIPTEERPGAMIKVIIVNGQAQSARYLQGDKVYAQATFKNGLPESRMVDRDGDGQFETIEIYGRDPSGRQNVLSDGDEKQIVANLFGLPAGNTGFYVKMIQIDANGDTIPEFTEEYTTAGGRISSWDSDGDGNWDTRYVKKPAQSDGILREDAIFHQPLSKIVITVSSENGIPVSINGAGMTFGISKSKSGKFYWIGPAGDASDEKKVEEAVNQNTRQGVSILVANGKKRMIAIRIEKMIFGEMLSEQEDIISK